MASRHIQRIASRTDRVSLYLLMENPSIVGLTVVPIAGVPLTSSGMGFRPCCGFFIIDHLIYRGPLLDPRRPSQRQTTDANGAAASASGANQLNHVSKTMGQLVSAPERKRLPGLTRQSMAVGIMANAPAASTPITSP
jgi:hypothetical protein